MNRLRGARIVFAKELVDILRDRRTIISMVLVPILIYPLMGMGLGSVISSQIEKTKAADHLILALPPSAGAASHELFAGLPQVKWIAPDTVRALLLADAPDDRATVEQLLSDDPTVVSDSIRATLYYRAIDAKIVRAVIELPTDLNTRLTAGDSAVVRIFSDQADIRSDAAGEHIEDWLLRVRDSLVAARLAGVGMDQSALRPIVPVAIDVAPLAKQSGVFLAALLPYMLIVLTLTGGMYPALDITAGEKERNTLETLLVAPVSRWDLAAGKFLAVFAAGIITMLLSTASMLVTPKFGAVGFGSSESDLEMAKAFSLSGESLAYIILLMIPTAVLFSSLLIAVSIAARSFKEGQSYTTPLLLGAIFPAMISLVPGIELNIGLALVPVVNISLALRDVILGTQNPLLLGLVFLSTVLYAFFALFVATRLFERESILFRT
jgi:sodium transport system permease protein